MRALTSAEFQRARRDHAGRAEAAPHKPVDGARRVCTDNERAASRDAWWLRGAARAVQPQKRTGMCGAWLAPAGMNGGQGASLRLTKSGAKWRGVAQCGHIWDCPACAATLKAERRTEIEHAIGGLGGAWIMLTLTVRHHEGMRLRDSLHVVKQAWRRTRKQRSVATWFGEHVRASVTSTEVTIGQSGWHPHLHILLALGAPPPGAPKGWGTYTETDGEGRKVKRDPVAETIGRALENEWIGAVDVEARALLEWSKPPKRKNELAGTALKIPPRVKGVSADRLARDYAPERGVGVHWSRPRDAKDAATAALYATKMALEASGEGKKSVTPFSILKALATKRKSGKPAAYEARMWREYVAATHGRRCIELDDRAARAARNHKIANAEILEQTDELPEPDEANVTKDDFRRLRALELVFPGVLRQVCESAVRMGSARAALDYWLAIVPRAGYLRHTEPGWWQKPHERRDTG